VGERAFELYRAALSARFFVVPKAQVTFPVWFSSGEQAQRYYAVRGNLFAREPAIPRHLYSRSRAYEAYLLENTLAGPPDGTPKSLARLLATEGVVATLFHRIVTSGAIQGSDRDQAFYDGFGTTRAQIDPLMNAYLKVFAAIREGGYDALAVVRAYQRLFPDERDALERIAQEVFLGGPRAAPPPRSISTPRRAPIWSPSPVSTSSWPNGSCTPRRSRRSRISAASMECRRP
jgi:hypothetical protein